MRSSSAAGRAGSSRPSSRRSGRVRTTPSADWGSATSPPESHGPSDRSSRSAATPASRASSSGAVSVPASGTGTCATIGPVSRPASMRISVTAVDGSPARIAAGHRRRAAEPRQRRRVEVEGAVTEVEQRRRHDLAVVGEDGELRPEREDRRDRVGVAQPRRGQDRVEVRRPGVRVDRGQLPGLVATGALRHGGDDRDEPDERVGGEALEGRDGERARPQEDRPDAPVVGRTGPGAHARALVASRTSASSSSPCPTAISSSIESR